MSCLYCLPSKEFLGKFSKELPAPLPCNPFSFSVSSNCHRPSHCLSQQGIAASDPGWVEGSVNALLQIARAEDAAIARAASIEQVAHRPRDCCTLCHHLDLICHSMLCPALRPFKLLSTVVCCDAVVVLTYLFLGIAFFTTITPAMNRLHLSALSHLDVSAMLYFGLLSLVDANSYMQPPL